MYGLSEFCIRMDLTSIDRLDPMQSALFFLLTPTAWFYIRHSVINLINYCCIVTGCFTICTFMRHRTETETIMFVVGDSSEYSSEYSVEYPATNTLSE